MTILSINISTQNPKTMIYTTLNRIRKQSPCTSGWKRLVRHLGAEFPMDKPFPMVEILNVEGEGIDYCLWALRAEPQHEKIYRLYAVRRARSVQSLTTDPRSIAAIDVAERHAHGNATNDELAAARAAASDVEWDTASDAASDAAWAATSDAAWAAAWDAAWAAASEVEWAEAESDLREMLTNHHAMPGDPAL